MKLALLFLVLAFGFRAEAAKNSAVRVTRENLLSYVLYTKIEPSKNGAFKGSQVLIINLQGPDGAIQYHYRSEVQDGAWFSEKVASDRTKDANKAKYEPLLLALNRIEHDDIEVKETKSGTTYCTKAALILLTSPEKDTIENWTCTHPPVACPF